MKLLSLLALSTFALPAAAQEMPQPSKELAKYAPKLGHFEGSGTFTAAPGAEPMPWTATVHCERGVGGFAIVERADVKFAAADMPPYSWVAIHGWDGENRRFISLGADSQGAGDVNEPFWADARTLITSSARIEEGQPVVQRDITRFTDSGYSIEIVRAAGTGEFFTYVKGDFKRTEGPKTIDASTTGAPPVAAPLKGLQPLVGKWKVVGDMVPVAGADPVPISGVETIRPILGGTVLEGRVVGDADPSGFVYDALSYMVWNERNRCWDILQADNMGMIGSSEMRSVEGKLVATGASLYMGLPTVNHMVLTMKDGALTGVVAHQIAGAGEPTTVFQARYERAE